MNKIKLKFNIVFSLCKYGIISKKNIVNEDELRVIELEDSNVQAILSSTNNIFLIKCDGRNYFFRACEFHSPSNLVLDELIDKYSMLFGMSSEFREMLCNSDRKKLCKLGAFNDFSSPVYQYFKTGDASIIGFDIDKTHVDKLTLDRFIHFAWSELLTWKLNEGGGKRQLFHYNRAKCQEELYKLFGVSDLICHTELVAVKGQYKTIGSIMEDAGGVNPLSMSSDKITSIATPLLHMNLTTLSIMDALCYERDHRPGNYNLILDQSGRAISIRAFDNDSNMTFLPITSVNKKFVRCRPVINKNGTINRAALNRDFAEKFMSVTDDQIKESSSLYLNPLQQRALVKRFHKLKAAIIKSMQSSKDFLLDEKDWNMQIVENDRSNGMNYFDLLLNWKEGEKDEVTLWQGKYPRQQAIL